MVTAEPDEAIFTLSPPRERVRVRGML